MFLGEIKFDKWILEDYISRNPQLFMKTLVIHPKDSTTDFLIPIYNRLKQTDVMRDRSLSTEEVTNLVVQYDRVILLGHGSPQGLLAWVSFATFRTIIDASHAEALRNVPNLICIWCYAEDFVREHRLNALCSGMFISEELEAYALGVEATSEQINRSNEVFAELMGQALLQTDSLVEVHRMVGDLYLAYDTDNPVILYNTRRWFLVGQ